ncbi:hypothetical protein LFM09_44390 [Lentzea alba]|uniref:hypothetical protein n=1 Tax=Lentzea alba TaxID=2714351 RepID=UPI0039BF74CA
MRPDVFVVWAHTSPGWDASRTQAWRQTVLGFTDLLNRHLGVDGDVDLYYQHEPVVWSALCQRRIEEADRIVAAVSPGWKLAFSQNNPQSPGAEFECRLLLELLVHEREAFDRRVIPVVLPGATKADIPLAMRSMQRFVVDPGVPESALALKHLLHGQPMFPKPAVREPRFRELARAGDPRVVAELLNTTVCLPDPGRPGLVATDVHGREKSVLAFTGLDRLMAYRELRGLPWEGRWLEVEGAELLPLVRPLEVGVVVDAGAPVGETVFVSAADIRVLTG